MYVGINKKVLFNYGDDMFIIDIKTNTLKFVGIKGKWKGLSETVNYTAVEICPKVYMLYWSESQNGSKVTQVQNWNTMDIYSNIAINEKFYNLKGKIILSSA